jgi:hypothetical protein
MDLIKEFFLEAFPNPDRIDCPSEETLVALAEERLLPGDPARLHVASCSECYAEYRGYCLEFQKKHETGLEIRKKEPSMKWSSIAADLRTEAPTRPKLLQGFRLWFTAFRRRYSR